MIANFLCFCCIKQTHFMSSLPDVKRNLEEAGKLKAFHSPESNDPKIVMSLPTCPVPHM